MEAEVHSDVAPLRELRRSDVSLYRQTSSMRLQILTDRHDVAGDGAEVLHQLDDFVERLPKTHHDSAFGQHAAAFAIAPGGGALQQRQRLLVNGIRPHPTVQTSDRFGVVVEDVGLRVEYGVQCRFIAIEVRNQNFNLALRIVRADLTNCFRPVRRAAGKSSRLTDVITACARFR